MIEIDTCKQHRRWNRVYYAALMQIYRVIQTLDCLLGTDVKLQESHGAEQGNGLFCQRPWLWWMNGLCMCVCVCVMFCVERQCDILASLARVNVIDRLWNCADAPLSFDYLAASWCERRIDTAGNCSSTLRASFLFGSLCFQNDSRQNVRVMRIFNVEPKSDR